MAPIDTATGIQINIGDPPMPKFGAGQSGWPKPYMVAAQRLEPGQWLHRPSMRPDGRYPQMRDASVAAQGFNRWAKRTGTTAAAYVVEHEGGDLAVVIAWSERPGAPGGVPGVGPEAVAKAALAAVAADAERRRQRAILERKLTGRGPVPGFDGAAGGAVKMERARRVSSQEGDE